MRKALSVVTSVLLSLAAVNLSHAVENTWDYAVQVSATVQASPAQITLSWPQDSVTQPSSYVVYRKAPADTSWGTGTVLSGTTTTYVDSNVTAGTAYEYQIVKNTSLYTGYGYIESGINVPMTDNRGKLLLVVDNSMAAGLTNELARLKQDLVGDGWTVIRMDVGRNDSVANVKSQIKAQYTADPTNVKAVFLFGHVPVPYSGDIVPDGHTPMHQGAWPCDGFYGDMTGTWTDSSVNDSGAEYARNYNVPGDGKYDQSSFPAPIKLMVGRVDLANMPGAPWVGGPATFPSELELLRNYLNKDHKFRTKQFDLPRRGLIGDYFGMRNGEAFAASAWRNFAPFFGANNITSLPNQGTWTSTLHNNSYLWAYGCGGGSFQTISGLGDIGAYNDVNTQELYSNDVKAVFISFFGSWLGDWDSTDNIMRCVLALPTYGLASCWSGRPHWYLHHMGLGETIGYGARLTQNNTASGLYQNQINSAAGYTHVALMGDPTLRMHIVAPPSNLTATTNSGSITLKWTASSDTVLGYHVYRATSAAGPFTRLTTAPITGTTYTDTAATGAANYMVRAVTLETSGSGTYYNPSIGAFLVSLGNATVSGGTTGGTTSGSGSTTTTNTPPVTTTNTPPVTSTNTTSGSTTSVIWVDDSLPAGAYGSSDGGDTWNWGSASPAPYSGTRSHQSAIASGMHQHYFQGATATLSVGTGDVLFTYVYVDPANPPSEIMLQWFDGTATAHRAYWGTSLLNWGTEGTAGQRYVGPLPTAGQWVCLQVPASQVGLEGVTVNGMAYTLYGGRATFDTSGKASATLTTPPSSGGSSSTTNTPPTTTTTNTATTVTVTNNYVWVNDAVPAGATTASYNDAWTWVSNNPAPYSGKTAHQSALSAGVHQHYFYNATTKMAVGTNATLFTYVYLDPSNPPSEVMLGWYDGTSWAHHAYWGANNFATGTNGTPSRLPMGALPATGKWVRLEVPANQVGLAGSTISGMVFTLYDGRATWDYSGQTVVSVTNVPTSTVTNTPPTTTTNTPPTTTTNTPPVTTTNTPPVTTTNTPSTTTTNTPSGTNSTWGTSTTTLPGANAVDYITPKLPKVGNNKLNVLTPTLLELKLINTQPNGSGSVSQWNLVDSSGNFQAPATSAFTVTVDGQAIGVTRVGFKRRPLYAPIATADLRIESSLYLTLSAPISDGQTIVVQNPSGTLWSSSTKFTATVNPLRYSPAIHVNQEGYVPSLPKKAMVGYYAGNLGEMAIPASGGFKIVNLNSGATVYQGTLAPRTDSGFTVSPTPYQQVYEADFSSFTTPGQYRLVVPGMGGSLPFQINDGVAMSFARAYALGLYHQRCGTSTALPFTRFTHDPCHTAPASVPSPQSSYPFTWNTIAGYANNINSDNPTQIAPRLTSESAQLFPFVNKGSLDVSGGHHDAGDYSKYTINSAWLTHLLMFTADSLPGVSDLDNLGIPESGDGIPDVLQEAKWEADFLAKMQDADGGFYFLVYPVNREYEGGATPDHGDPQVVWPKTSSATAVSVAALAQCASSPLMKKYYPQAAATYLAKAKLGWTFLQNAIAKYGKNGIYQKITHYGDMFADSDDLAWAACEMFLATGDSSIHQTLLSWFDPASTSTWMYGWEHMYASYGNAIRSYAFAARNGRMAASQLDATFLAKCQAQIAAAADDALTASQQSAYGTSYPSESKAIQMAGWYFSGNQAFDITVAYQLNAKQAYLDAIVRNINYEAGCNPVNASSITGVGWRRTRDLVSQWAAADSRVLPPSGIPIGNIVSSFGRYMSLYSMSLEGLCFPSDTASTAPYPMYDRWQDSWNVMAEMVETDIARGLANVAFLAGQTSLKSQAWKSVPGQITITGNGSSGTPVSATLKASGVDLSGARITWEARDHEPVFASTFSFTPVNSGTNWVEAEAQLPDGRRIFAATTFVANLSGTNTSGGTTSGGTTTGGTTSGGTTSGGTTSGGSTSLPSTAWMDDSLPAGAYGMTSGGDTWNWVSSNPTPASGTLAHQSAVAAGTHWHGFAGATATMSVGVGDRLYCYVYLDPNNLPSEIMLQWADSTGASAHRAYWGTSLLNWGTEGTASQRYVGPLPAAGQWVRLEVPASQVGLEGATVTGMTFILYGGRATFDATGRYSATASVTPTGSPAGNPVSGVSLQLADSGAMLTWPATPNSTYQVAYKNSLSDTTWTPADQVIATDTTVSWLDAAAEQSTQRFYVVAQMN